jgi:ribosomal-protein-alanine N-acetyltransferase
MATDPIVMRHLGSVGAGETPDAWIDRQRASLAEHGLGYLAVEVRETGQFVGAVGLARVRYEAHFTPAIHIGWRLARQHWGHGYASEAARALLHHGFEQLGCEEIVAVTVPANVRSQAVMRRLGMTYSSADDFDHPRLPEGHALRRHVLYRMKRSVWEPSPAAGPAGYRNVSAVSRDFSVSAWRRMALTSCRPFRARL